MYHEIFYTDIIKILPHRKPFLFIDYAKINKEKMHAIGYKNVLSDDFFFRGHFPGNPIMPGVIILEAMAQISGLLSSSSGKNMYLISINNSKFKDKVFPNCLLSIESKFINSRLNFYTFDCVAKVKNKICATASISAILN